MLVAIPLLPWAALVSAPILHPRLPLRVVRALLCGCVSVAALVLYTLVRKKFYPVAEGSSPVSALPETASALARAFTAFLHWFQQPQLPHHVTLTPDPALRD